MKRSFARLAPVACACTCLVAVFSWPARAESGPAGAVDARALPGPKPVDFNVMFLDPRQALRDYELYQIDDSTLQVRDGVVHFTYRQHFMTDGTMARVGIAIPAVVDCEGHRRSDVVDGQSDLQPVRPGTRGARQVYEACRRIKKSDRWTRNPLGDPFPVVLAPGIPLANACRYVRGDSTPVEWRGNRLLVSGSIDGTPVPMIIDTGSSDVVVSASMADKLKLPNNSSVAERAYGAGGMTTVSFSRTETMAVGNIGRMGLVAHVDHDSESHEVMIGGAFLLDYDLEINDHEMAFFQGDKCGDESLAYWDPHTPFAVMEAIDDHFGSRRIVIHVTLDGRPIRALVDTGAPTTLLDVGAARALGVDPAKDGAGTFEAPAIGTHHLTVWSPRQFGQFEIAGEVVSRPMFAIADLFANARNDMGVPDDSHLRNPPDMILGADFLRSHRMLIARSQNRMYLSRTDGAVLGAAPKTEVSQQAATVFEP
jgi:predicted aspartyl protease